MAIDIPYFVARYRTALPDASVMIDHLDPALQGVVHEARIAEAIGRIRPSLDPQLDSLVASGTISEYRHAKLIDGVPLLVVRGSEQSPVATTRQALRGIDLLKRINQVSTGELERMNLRPLGEAASPEGAAGSVGRG